ncbi:calcium-binding protein [Neorhizobium alkalisoli]|uniref:Hemolysin type calcium-binding protein n=1 Tax=Neorhizobium alkalisoli TaxID=528178 RepID=A0A561R3G4_9HYPH|nr:hypothetical protein [Neorhizobium alkalisoli]TWF57168.1 hemolysin type calcium-binding protein [Neorhizobium alkalisoli]
MTVPSTPKISNLTINEHSANGTILGTLSSTDPDGTAVSYELITTNYYSNKAGYNTENATGYTWEEAYAGTTGHTQFAIDGNKVVVVGDIDYEESSFYYVGYDYEEEPQSGQITTYSFQIKATDANGEVSYASFAPVINNINETIYGTNGKDTISAIVDIFGSIIDGKGGNDVIRGNLGTDNLLGGSGNDLVRGGYGNDIVKGGNGDDHLYGDEDDDIISGGMGYDVMRGGSGRDTFVFESHYTSKVSKPDLIVDFKGAETVDLSAIDANLKEKGDQSFEWIGANKFSGEAGELRFGNKGGDTYVYADLNGDKKADFGVHFKGNLTLAEHMFLL